LIITLKRLLIALLLVETVASTESTGTSKVEAMVSSILVVFTCPGSPLIERVAEITVVPAEKVGAAVPAGEVGATVFAGEVGATVPGGKVGAVVFGGGVGATVFAGGVGATVPEEFLEGM
jgi:hypothetical protein